MNNPWLDSLYALAERLSMPVYQIKREMPLDEFIGWMRYFNKDGEPKLTDLTQMSPDQLAAMFQ